MAQDNHPLGKLFGFKLNLWYSKNLRSFNYLFSPHIFLRFI
jgi:hypothetical protein